MCKYVKLFYFHEKETFGQYINMTVRPYIDQGKNDIKLELLKKYFMMSLELV